MSPKTMTTAVVAIAAASWLTGCGSTSGGGTASSTQQAMAGQICGQQAAAKPGYKAGSPRMSLTGMLAAFAGRSPGLHP
jgi:phosphate transport system substrate-binding protein